MHLSSMKRMEWFVTNYLENNGRMDKIKVLDVGSYDVNGSYKTLFNSNKFNYTGIDIEMGPNVDIVPANPYSWAEISNNSYDVVISGQALEHMEYPWLTMTEIARVMKNDGICCIIAPSTQSEHRYPYDCYRYYPDGMRALAKQSGLEVLHVSTGGVPDRKATSDWDSSANDTMLVAVKKKNKYIWGKIDGEPPQLKLERRVTSIGDSYFDLVKYVLKRPILKFLKI